MTSLVPKEKGPNTLQTVETAKLVVNQPKKLQELNLLLESFDALDRRVSERTGEDRSGDLGAAGAGTAAGAQQTTQSARDLAIAAMPQAPKVLRDRLVKHIGKEISHLQALSAREAHTSRPGVAFRLNKLYARIRRLNALLVELLEASIDILRRLFIRVFIDEQSIL
ncbi:MAG: hypothetical protein WCS85_00240 [Candidatus Peribacteraceae bacterium]